MYDRIEPSCVNLFFIDALTILYQQVERVFSASHPDASELEKAKKMLKVR